MARLFGRLASGAVVVLLAACGGSSGGGPAPVAPVIVGAAFVSASSPGTGATPVAGDTLVLQMSQDIQLTGSILDDSDVVFTPATASLGAVAAAPTLVSARALSITLGAGVSIDPATTTIAFAADQDAVMGTNNLFAGGGAVTITDGDGDSPTISLLTLNGVDTELNGNGSAGGVLQVPRAGFSIDITATDPTSAIGTTGTLITANKLVAGVAAGDNLAGLFTASQSGDVTSYAVPAAADFPDGPIVITAVAADITGMTSAPVSFSFTVRIIDDVVRPFPTTVNASQVWFLDTSRDLESYTFVGGGISPLRVNAGANARADFEDLLLVVGLFGPDSATNGVARGLIETAILAWLGELFTGINVNFTFTSPGTFPGGGGSVAYASATFSQICIGGAPSTTGVLGLAILNPNNNSQENNCLESFGAFNDRLGVFVHTLVNTGLLPSSTVFRATFLETAPPLGGTAVNAADMGRLTDPGGNPGARTNAIHDAIDRLGRAIAVVLAHECGHSMGLVRNGAMPAGLYGGDPVNFPLPMGVDEESATGHIVNSSLFPGAAQNVMSPALSFTGVINSGTLFNSLNLAYLRETVLYNP